MALHEDEEAVRRLAASAHLLLRSSVATARRLPPDVVERLARDEDRVVRLFLAERCDDAPADVLLEVWQWWNGSYSTPDRPYGHPNFPRRDLLRYADHPHPRLRQLALDDPDSTPALVERFSGDEDAEVRLRAATDPGCRRTRWYGCSTIRTAGCARWRRGTHGCPYPSSSHCSTTRTRRGPRPGTRRSRWPSWTG